MRGMLDLEGLRALVEAGEVDTVVAAQTDMQGRLMGKRFHARHFVEEAWEETHSCNYLLATDMEMDTVPGYASASWAKGYGDHVMRPDMSTLRLTPWAPGTALVLCDVLDHHDHAPVSHAPREMLRRQVNRLAERGLTPMMASELEFFTFRQSFGDADAAGHRGLEPVSSYNEDYHILQTAKEEGLMRALRNGLDGAGVPVENTKGEADAGQAEINVRYADALTMADRHVLVKAAAKEIAFAQGRAVTFMARWSNAAAGSSCHVHQSLAGAEGPAFHDAEAELGMSATMRSYLAGQLRHARAIALALAPFSNSYKRFVTGLFAPTKAVWGLDNRTAGFRVVAEGGPSIRVECRIGGADLNPYVASAALLAAGLDGIERGMELEPAFSGDAYGGEGREIPKTLREAIEAFEGSEMLRAALGEDVVAHYAHAARWEQSQADAAVTDWDLRRGFERA